MNDGNTTLKPRRRDRAHAALGGLLVALAAFVLWQLEAIPADGGYSAVGPRFTPMLIGIGLAVVGVVLLVQALAGGWKGLEGTEPAEPFFAPAFAWIAGGLGLHMAVIGVVGFTLAATLLFAMVARGFGSRRLVRNAAIGFVLAACIFLLFTRVLNLQLPAGPLRVL
jgi:putative tricarboxylic transport membrane protein